MLSKTAELVEKIRKFSGKRLLLVTHRNADIDALSSMALFKFLVKKVNPELYVDTFIPGKTSTRASTLQKYLGMEVLEEPLDFSVYDAFVFIDVGGIGVLEEAADIIKLERETWLIDHHVPQEDFLKLFNFVFLESANVSSTCEIVSEACETAKVALPRKFLIALLAAIMVESRFLRVARCKTFSIVEDLCRRGVSFEDVSFLLGRERDLSAKIAVLKSLKRMELYRCGDWIIALSRVGAYQSNSANILSNIGVDFAAVGGESDSGCKVSIRLSTRFLETFNLTAGGDFVDLLAKTFKGSGGGHSTIGAVTLESGLDEVFNLLKNFLEDKFYDLIGEKLHQIL
ncbi:MAG: bifunctional oligoribonuclease/PAP phosphatase NrnA [Candidatus Geothermarchaeales archaeon]